MTDFLLSGLKLLLLALLIFAWWVGGKHGN